jgi:hypothetical protein
MTEMDWARRQAELKWILGTFDRLVETFRSAPTDQTKSAALNVIEEFGLQLQIPNRQIAAEPIPKEHKTLIEEWEQSQDMFEQWMSLSRMNALRQSFNCMVNLLQTRSYDKNHPLLENIESHRSEWLQLANLQDRAEPGLADEYEALIDEWERVEHKFQRWALRETPVMGSA